MFRCRTRGASFSLVFPGETCALPESCDNKSRDGTSSSSSGGSGSKPSSNNSGMNGCSGSNNKRKSSSNHSTVGDVSECVCVFVFVCTSACSDEMSAPLGSRVKHAYTHHLASLNSRHHLAHGSITTWLRGQTRLHTPLSSRLHTPLGSRLHTPIGSRVKHAYTHHLAPLSSRHHLADRSNTPTHTDAFTERLSKS